MSSSRTRQRVQTGKIGGSQGGRARAPPSSHLKRATSTAKSILQSRASDSLGERRKQIKKPVGRLPEIDISDLTNEFNLPKNKSKPWLEKFAAAPYSAPARSLAELKRKRALARRPNLHKAVDVDGDGIIDEIELKLSKLLESLQGEDLDGDGIVTEEELNATKVAKGKEILARQFVESHGHVRDFWPDFHGMTNDQIIKAITKNVDYRMLMSNLTNKAMQHELLYDSHRVADSIRIMATDRERRWQRKKAELAANRSKLFKSKLNATINAHRESKAAEAEHESKHHKRKHRTFTPMLETSFANDANELYKHVSSEK